MSAFRTLDDAGDLKGKRVLVRVDLNVPTADGKVTDDTRIRAVAPTIKEIAAKGGKVILLAHFGRPKGGPEAKYSLKQVVPALVGDPRPEGRLRRGLHRPGRREGGCGDGERRRAGAREHPLPSRRGEERSGIRRRAGQARRRLCQRCVLRRPPRARLDRGAGASSCRPSPAVPCSARSRRCRRRSAHPKRPVVAIVGGAKVSSKIELLEHLADKVDTLVIGGGMANTFLARQGHEDRQVARRTGPHRDGQSHHGRRQQGGLHDRASR